MNPTRRGVLGSAVTFAAAAALNGIARGAEAPASAPATAAASKPATTTAATTQSNGKPNIAVIGCGGMTTFHGGYLPKYTNVVALADVDKSHLDAYNANIAGGKAFISNDYRKVLERKDIDLVLIGTPDHWHTKIAADALRAGKDVYCEKPLTLTMDEGRFLTNIVRQTGRIFQVGTQQRSENQFNTAIALARAGRLGKIRYATVVIGPTTLPNPADFVANNPPPELDWNMWLGQAPQVKYIKQRCHNDFRWWYEYSGGRMTDWGAHHVDIAQAAIAPDLPGPHTIDPRGVELPVPFEHGYPTNDHYFNTAAKYEVTCSFANGVEMLIADKVERFPSDNGVMILGDAGSLFVNRDKIVGPAYDALKDHPLPEGYLTLMPPGSAEGPHERHFVNFLNCVKTRQTPRSDIFEHVRNLATCHLANIAMRVGRKIHWDATAQKITGDDEANAMQSRTQRKGFEVV